MYGLIKCRSNNFGALPRNHLLLRTIGCCVCLKQRICQSPFQPLIWFYPPVFFIVISQYASSLTITRSEGLPKIDTIPRGFDNNCHLYFDAMVFPIRDHHNPNIEPIKELLSFIQSAFVKSMLHYEKS